MSGIVTAVGIGLTCGVIVNVFYAAIRHAWPFNYFGLEGSVDPIISRNLLRYILFRFVPPAVAVVASGVTSERQGASPWLGGVVALAIHARPLILDVLRLLRARRLKSARNRGIVLGAVVTVSLAALQVRSSIAGIIPEPSDLVANLWASILAAIGAVYVGGIALVKRSVPALVADSFKTISVELGRYAVSKSMEKGVDPRITLAIMCVENLQRPRWLRVLESKVPGMETKGIMQATGARNDTESIDYALEDHIVPWGPPELMYGSNDIEPYWIERKARDYNPDRNYAGLVRAAFETITESPEIVRPYYLGAGSSP